MALSSEHRLVPRRSGETVGPLRLRVQAVGIEFSANVRDISILGIGIIAGCTFASGTPLIVETGPTGRSLPQELVAEVRHVTALPDGNWLLGCRFSRHLTTDDVEVLG